MPLLLGKKPVILHPFSPAQLPGLSLWLAADYGVRTQSAAGFVAASSQYLSIADNASLSTGDVDFWIAGWVYATSVAGNPNIFTKWASSGAGHGEYDLIIVGTKFRFAIYNAATANTVTATTFGNLSTATWYFVMAYHDSVTNVVGISVNGGAFDTAGTTIAPPDSDAPVEIAAEAETSFFGGRIAHLAFGKSPPGGIAAIATSIRDVLYNGGNGVDLRTISSATRTAWGGVSAWPLGEAAGATRVDVWGTSNLADNNTVTAAQGPYEIASADGDLVSKWTDRSIGGNSATQATGANKPLLKLAIVNGKPVLRFDGTNDHLNSPIALPTGGMHVFLVWRANSNHLGYLLDSNSDGVKGITFQLKADGSGYYWSFLTGAADQFVTRTYSNGWHIVAGSYDLATVRGWHNGTSELSASSAGTMTSDDLDIGATPGGGSPFNGDIAELIICNQNLPTGLFSQTVRYLGSKYGQVVA